MILVKGTPATLKSKPELMLGEAATELVSLMAVGMVQFQNNRGHVETQEAR